MSHDYLFIPPGFSLLWVDVCVPSQIRYCVRRGNSVNIELKAAAVIAQGFKKKERGKSICASFFILCVNTLHKSVYTITPWNQETSNRISIYSGAVKKKRGEKQKEGEKKWGKLRYNNE